jgi:hypothetical protein
MDKARRMFAAVVRKGAAPEALIQAAKLYAIAVTGKAERWIKHPANWLNDGDWRKPPPGVVIDEAGNVVAIDQPPPQDSSGSDRVMEIYEATRAELAKTNPWWAS